jgi:hypothetical protein
MEIMIGASPRDKGSPSSAIMSDGGGAGGGNGGGVGGNLGISTGDLELGSMSSKF